MKLTEKEIDSVSKLKPFKRYKYFIKRIADFEEMWTLVGVDGTIALSEIDDYTFLSFWTAEQFIESNLKKGWKDSSTFKITLDDFKSTFIPLISENKYLINIFPVNGKSGFIVSLEEFIRDLNEELENY